jgi:ribosomal protein S20
MRTHVRSAREAIATGNHGEETRTQVAAAARVIDRMITRGLVHKSTGARYKSRLMRHYNKLAPARPDPAAALEPPPVEAVETENTATE